MALEYLTFKIVTFVFMRLMIFIFAVIHFGIATFGNMTLGTTHTHIYTQYVAINGTMVLYVRLLSVPNNAFTFMKYKLNYSDLFVLA